MAKAQNTHGEAFWVFGYGSLIWKPGIDYQERCKATLYGFHRAFCVWSVHWRGTADAPGLVLGLDRGGAACGMAYRVSDADWPQVRHYLRAREQVTMVYQEAYHPVRLSDGRTVRALAFTVDRTHRQYAGKLSLADQAQTIAKAHGLGGPNHVYLAETRAALHKEGMRDSGLDAVQKAVSAHLDSGA